MQQQILTVQRPRALTADVRELVLTGDLSAVTAPGQFVNVQLPGFFLRRPISVCDFGGGTLTLVYKIVGDGTAALARAVPGDRLDVLTGLGNGYDLAKSGDRPLLIGGGVVYTLGIIFYRLKNVRYAHSIWHLFVLGGSILHFFSILLYVFPGP